MPLTGLVLIAIGAVYAYFYRTSPDLAKQQGVNALVARYGRILCPAAGAILLLIWVVQKVV